ncbi:hypothetical protein ABDD95_00720 [Mucilaginibacter sp. PAMB04274]|uniref:hypothetical protein n=1 Tax=Mucilaginibacter sp. PAMB04274 TaxID=3138568 RepID=UPI0031F6EB61
MSESKIQIKIGSIEFSGEGQQDWLSLQIDKILNKLPELLKNESVAQTLQNGPTDHVLKASSNKVLPTLSIWLKDKGATTIQTKKFLATAAHIQLNGKSRVTTGDVNAALKNANQTKLNNSSDCLNQNVSKGFCEKDTQGFFITVQGLADLGINE